MKRLKALVAEMLQTIHHKAEREIAEKERKKFSGDVSFKIYVYQGRALRITSSSGVKTLRDVLSRTVCSHAEPKWTFLTSS